MLSPYGKSELRPGEIQTIYEIALREHTREEILKKTQENHRLLIDKYCLKTPIFLSPNTGAKLATVHDERIYNTWQEMWRPDDAWMEKK